VKQYDQETNAKRAIEKASWKVWWVVWRPAKYKAKKNINWETDIDIVTRIVRQTRQRKRDWSGNQRARRAIAKHIPELKDLIEWYEYMHKLRDIFDEENTVNEWKQKISQWIADWEKLRKRTIEVDNMITTIENRFDTICNYFISRHTNWYAEWLHSRIQRMISMSRWFLNKDYMIYRILRLCSSNYHLF
jgi:hypothetical protein